MTDAALALAGRRGEHPMFLWAHFFDPHAPYEPPAASDEATAHARIDLERSLARLSDTSRVVVILHDVEGYTHREIAELLGRSVSFSKSQLARAHQRLRRAARAASEVAVESEEVKR